MKKIVIAPHVDDEVIGCGGSVLDAETLVFYCGVDSFHGITFKGRFDEAKAVAEITGQDFQFRLGDGIRHAENVNHYDMHELIAPFETLMEIHHPDRVYIPWPSYNQDHQAVYAAAMVALRPHDRNWFVPQVLLYEEPDCWWPGVREPFVPNYYAPINIDNKLRLYLLMESQVRGHRSVDHLRALAEVRGAAIMQRAAEAFHILRWVVP